MAIFEQSLVQLYDTEGWYSLVEELVTVFVNTFIWSSVLLFVIFLRASTGSAREEMQGAKDTSGMRGRSYVVRTCDDMH